MTKLSPSGAGRLAKDYPDVWDHYKHSGNRRGSGRYLDAVPAVC